ncbi:MAG: porin [Halanaerobiales bacterium]|nr:porin [Halanaerobiales bacterium]
MIFFWQKKSLKPHLKVQKNNFKLQAKLALTVLISMVLVLMLSPSSLAADIGGKASLISNLSYSDSELDNSLAAELELEWFLPYDFPLDIQNRAVISLDEEDEDKVDLWFKKLYLRQELGPFTAKLGRQPVSWAYGALINPVDYSLGAENLEEENRAKYVDGVELYYPINWGTGITFLSTDIEGEKNHKWSIRGRTTYAGYDLTANYISTPSSESEGDLDRYGLTAKGDLGPFGVYGAYGLWENRSIEYDIYQVGADYSYHFLRGSQLYLQGEYILIDGAAASEGFDLFSAIQDQNSAENGEQNSASNKMEFINTNISYDIDEFSSIGFMTVTYLGDGSTLFIPKYSYLFSSNLLLELRGTAAAGAEEEVLGGDQKGLELNLSYTF